MLIKPFQPCNFLIFDKKLINDNATIIKTLSFDEIPLYFLYKNNELILFYSNKIIFETHSIDINVLDAPYFKIQNEWFTFDDNLKYVNTTIEKRWNFNGNFYNITMISNSEFKKNHDILRKPILDNDKIFMTESLMKNFQHGCFTFDNNYILSGCKLRDSKNDEVQLCGEYFVVLHKNRLFLLKYYSDFTWTTIDIGQIVDGILIR